MNSKQVERYMLRFLEALNCEVLEKTSSSLLVKLSPEADKELTGRSYYWSFVEKTGVPAETMTMRFVFDPAAEARIGTVAAPGSGGPPPMAAPPGTVPLAAAGTASPAAASTAPPAGAPAGPTNSILGRYFGVQLPPISRIPTDSVAFGSRRLNQIFQTVQRKGSCVRLFEDSGRSGGQPRAASAEPWLCVNYRVELISDMKREELHSLGLQLATGRLVENFWDKVRKRKLTPRIPAGIHLLPAKYTLNRAASLLEAHLEKKLKAYDFRWAEEARDRLAEELARIDGFYEESLKGLEEEELAKGQEQYTLRREEAEWQYSPRVRVSAVNCAMLHLLEEV
ncbi:YqhG family protein [Gorillibacterium sp. sgz500922]|uniref:YqhG family protein n=1 Tax=Gorillibacterium sp. sgz500922 TaxID=3446694 RepID=UPI003F67525D